jgi:P-type Cu+ transporter
MTILPSAGKSTVKDPICGMSVDPATAAGKYERDGRTYYFCSRHCLEKFRAQKERPTVVRIGGVAGGATPAPAMAPNTCPMHPEVVQSGPGSCPTCGMSLEPRKRAGAAEPAAAAASYTCPMHPEVVRSEPGTCPTCGMSLEPRTGAGAATPAPAMAPYTCPMHPEVV